MEGSAVFYRSPGDEYPTIVRGSGVYLWDDTGKEYLDLASGISATAGIGQGRDDIADAMADQVRKLTFVHNARVSNEPQELLARRLVDLAPDGVNKVMFTSGGSESNELALRITRQYHLANGDWERTKVVSLSPSYHGATVGALSMTGNWQVTRPYEAYLMNNVKVTAPISYRGPFAGLNDTELAERAAGAVAAAIEAVGPHTVAAFMAEPISPAAGMAVPPAQYWQQVREICDEYGVLFIADEIVSGSGRTGAFNAFMHFDVVPDITNLAKGLSAGYVPLGASLLRDKVVDAIAVNSRSMAEVHTFSGAPVSCATGLAVLNVIEKEGLVDAAAKRGAALRAMLEDQLGDHPNVGEIRGIGLMQAVEYVRSKDSREKFSPEARVSESLTSTMVENGFLLFTLRSSSAFVGDMTVIFPALTIEEAELERAVVALREAVHQNSPDWN